MHEAVGAVLGPANQVISRSRLAFLVDKPPQPRRGPATLVIQPLPVSRQQGDFAAPYAQFGPPTGLFGGYFRATSGLCCRRPAFIYRLPGAGPQVDIDLAPITSIKK